MPEGIEFRDIKPHGTGQSWAFEELCYQLFSHEYRSAGEPVRREGSGGDGGIEGFIEDNNGRVIIGLQAKYFVNEFASSQWKKIDDSVKTALRNNAADNTLREIIVATTRVFTATQRKKWNTLRNSWKALAQTLGHTKPPKFVHWDASYLTGLLLKEVNRGQLLYWFKTPKFDRKRCADLTASTIQCLEERYIPDLHTRTECESTIHRFLRTNHAHSEFCEKARERLNKELDRPWITYSKWSDTVEPLVAEAKRCLQAVITRLGDGFSIPAPFQDLISSTSDFNDAFRELSEVVRDYDQSGTLFKDLFGYSEGLYFDDRFVVADQQCLLVLGDAGKGKTHTLSEICTRYSQAGGAVLFTEGAQFGSDTALWSQFLRWVDFNGGIRDFLACFSAMSETSPFSGLICIDALNESTPHRDVWLNGLHAFVAELRTFPRIKLIVSCRSDYAELTIPQSIRERKAPNWSVTTHHGLGMNVFDAVPKYLKAYNVRGFTPQLFLPEFETPLILKTFCEAFASRIVPHGTLSLTTILKAYVERKSRDIRRTIGCPKAAVQDALRSFADAMAKRGRLKLSEQEARQICLAAYPEVEENRSLYRALVSEGVMHELPEPASDPLGDQRTVRFAFERIWDFFLCEHLWPSCSRSKAVSPDLLLVLQNKKWRISHSGPLGMLAIRLPEAGLGELHDVIGIEPNHHDGRSIDVAFRESIQWRTQKCCTERTRELINSMLIKSDSTFKLLVSIALHEDHPWNADYLHSRLEPMSLGERDRAWTLWLNSELVRNSDGAGVVRIIRIAEEAAPTLMSDSQALLCGTTLVWMLTTTVVAARKRISVAIANLLKGRCDVAALLFARFEGVNDPYVLDRLLLPVRARQFMHPRTTKD